jgi:hypothetical protein
MMHRSVSKKSPQLLPVRAALPPGAALTALRRELLQIVHPPLAAPAKPATRPASLNVESTETTASQRALLGQRAPKVAFVGGLPSAGRSGWARQLPILQLAPRRLLPTLEGLGVGDLAELLARLLVPEARGRLAGALGLPRPNLLMVALRAELLDLPAPERGSPHVKDTLWLSRLGIFSVADLAALATPLAVTPDRLDGFGKLLSALQDAAPTFVGKQKVTRHDLRAWVSAAVKRGSDVVVPEARSEASTEVAQLERHDEAAELVLEAFLTRRRSDPEALWHELCVRAITWLSCLGKKPETWKGQLSAAVDSAMAGLVGGPTDAHAGAFAPWVLADGGWTLFGQLLPWVRPEGVGDEALAFIVDPAPWARACLSSYPRFQMSRLALEHVSGIGQ